jgi:hypothetical protein
MYSDAQMILSSEMIPYRIVVMPTHIFRTVHEIGIHSVVENLQEVQDAMEQAERDLFPTIFLYTNDPNLLALIREYYSAIEQVSIESSMLCTFCDSRFDETTDWLETSEGDIACEQCQYDACAHFGQLRNNIKHMNQTMTNLLTRWSQE